MDLPELYVAGCASWLPRAVPVAEEVAAGRVSEAEAARLGALSVTVAGPLDSGASMAGRAARAALLSAGLGADDVGLVLHATLYDQGHDLWGAASCVQRLALSDLPGGRRLPWCPAVEVRQVSNGGMASLALAAAGPAAGSGRPAALLTAGDVYCPPGFDRWNSDPGTVYADGGAALVLAADRGFARLRSLVTWSDPELEGMHRGDRPFRPPAEGVRRVDLDACKRQFLAAYGRVPAIARVVAGQRQVLREALERAGTDLAGITAFVLPHLGRRRLEAAYFTPFGIDPERTTWPWSRRVGHLGAGDQFAGLARLAEEKRLAPGDRVLLAGVGAGFTWSAAVLDIVETPPVPVGDI